MIDPHDAPRFTREELEAVQPPDNCPADFDIFWRSTFQTARRIDPDVRSRQIWSPDADIDVFEVFFTSWENVRIGAWVIRPQQSRGGMVVGHGYGGLPFFDTALSRAGYTAIMPCVRGFHLSAHREIPSMAQSHVVHGIDDRDAYVIRGSVADLWLAATVLTTLYPDTAQKLVLNAGSFGGGLGALALAVDHRFKAAHLEVPTFGHHPIRLQIPSTGSAEAVRLYSLEHPEVADVLAYYDAATAAVRIRIPVLCSPALFDPAVTPQGQWAVVNAIKDKELFIHPLGHFPYPELEETKACLAEQVLQFFGRKLAE